MNRALCFFNRATVLLSGMLLVAPVLAQETNSEDELLPPDNWYQVEVILFTQQGNLGGETPPQEYRTEFPDNWLELVDPNMPEQENGLPLAAGALLAATETEFPDQRLIPLVSVQDPALSNEAGGSDIINDSDNPSADDLVSELGNPTTDYEPQYESPFRLVDAEFRDLNESATALDRRQYNVVFHEAWRFPAQGEELDPWIIIKAGQSLEGRYQIEGALRFYKSRFLHFQPNLWLLEFANDNDQLIELPDFPVKAPSVDAEIELSEAFSNFEINDLDAAPNDLDSVFETLRVAEETSQPIVINDTITQSTRPFTEIEYPSTQQTNPLGLSAPVDDLAPLLISERNRDKKYPVASVWVLDRSKRIDEDEIYYIDHPQMGAIVTIKSYSPELLNPLPAATDETIEAGEVDDKNEPLVAD